MLVVRCECDMCTGERETEVSEREKQAEDGTKESAME